MLQMIPHLDHDHALRGLKETYRVVMALREAREQDIPTIGDGHIAQAKGPEPHVCSRLILNHGC